MKGVVSGLLVQQRGSLYRAGRVLCFLGLHSQSGCLFCRALQNGRPSHL